MVGFSGVLGAFHWCADTFLGVIDICPPFNVRSAEMMTVV